MKLLTAVAALRTLGPERRFSTRVVAGAAPGSVVLTGGGDVLLGAGESAPDEVLGHAGLATLAAVDCPGPAGQRRQPASDGPGGRLPVHRPRAEPGLGPEDVAAGEVAPLFPLALNSARFDPAVTTGPRPQDSAMTAAEAFAAQLAAGCRAAGLTVAPGVGRVPAATDDGGARVLAEVQSATVGQQVDLMLQTSDNYLAEALGRMAALAAGQPGSNDGATAAVLQQLDDLEIPAAHPARSRTSPGWRWTTRSPPASSPKWSGPSPPGADPGCGPRWPGSRSPA